MSTTWILTRSARRLAALAALLLTAPLARADDHAGYLKAKPEECADCHRGSNVPPNHGAGFLKEHRLLATKAAANCASCHAQAFCVDCHKGGASAPDARQSLSRRGEPMPTTHGPGFVGTHALKAAGDPRACYRCHDSGRYCQDCHQRSLTSMNIRRHAPTYLSPGVPDPAWVSTHRAEARRSLQSCQGCHPQKSSCSSFACHPGLGGR